jgi:hypothetical protein
LREIDTMLQRAYEAKYGPKNDELDIDEIEDPYGVGAKGMVRREWQDPA